MRKSKQWYVMLLSFMICLSLIFFFHSAQSTGRGGIGNIATDRSRSRGPGERSASRGRGT